MTLNNDGEAPVMKGLQGMPSTPSLQSLSGPLLPGVVAPDRALSMDQIELFHIWAKCKQMSYAKSNS